MPVDPFDLIYEITHRFQTARPEVRQLLLQYLLPWLHNMELVDPNVPPGNPLSYFQYYSNDPREGRRREGWGSVEATEMVLNNLFYITAKFADEHPKETEEIWSTLCSCWPNNLKVIIRYLLIISGMAPTELLPYAKRVVLYLARARPDRLLDEMMGELQTVETLNCLIERTETPPFYRLTSMRKASSHSDPGPGLQDPASRVDLAVEKGTIHTKRHSGEDPGKTGTSKSDSALRAMAAVGFVPPRGADKIRTASGPAMLSDENSTPTTETEVDKLQSQLRWTNFPGVHALLLKGCTSPNTYEPVMTLLSQFTPLLDLSVVDPTQSVAFPMNVIALLPYMLLHYEDANPLCIISAESIAQVGTEKSKKLENLGTVMTLYSRHTFSKESFQWTKCVVKYLYDAYAHLSLNMLAFLIEVLEKGPSNIQLPVLSIIHCMLHYVDLSSASAAAQPVYSDLLRVIAKYIEGVHWKEALKVLKLVVTRSSSLVAPPMPAHTHSSGWEPNPDFIDVEISTKKELPGRTMDFTFDLSQTPLIGRRFVPKPELRGSPSPAHASTTTTTTSSGLGLSSVGTASSPRRSVSLSPADSASVAGWKRPWMSQGRVRECLVNLLTACGQRVGLPKSPSVIFSQSSDLLERQSSVASSTEEVSGPELSAGSQNPDHFGVFKDFDFLEYESESVEGESTDNFNWGVRRRPISEGEAEAEADPGLRAQEESLSEKTPILSSRKPSKSTY
ncbi:hypothetical protein LSTR_LSTR014742 [Laodelphax striatellus]|uniref:Uncharacterized protein n=1 Tax=Laodelphax striatellus TaxID=195883 RepID=A0A482XHG7_LAOST|nr:hypothetical protein LSTR_LSTR014742 [Laodelphax striatellus]